MEKKENSTKSTHEIVVENFFIFLHESGKTMKEYAIDNNIDRTTLSKWRSGVTSMTVDQIKMAAKYFGKTVNDFYYTKEEKKHLEVLTDKNYHPVMAQQSLVIKDYTEMFHSPLRALMEQIYLLVCVMIISAIVAFYVPWGIFLCLIYPLYAYYYFYFGKYAKKRTFIVNYLDDIFYKLEESQNNSYKPSIVLVCVASLILVALSINQYVMAQRYDGNVQVYLYILFGFSIFYIFLQVSLFSEWKINLKAEIYDNEIISYYHSYAIFCMGVIYLFMLIVAIVLTQSLYFYLVFGIILGILSYAIFYVVSKEHRKYSLYYAQANHQAVKMFNK